MLQDPVTLARDVLLAGAAAMAGAINSVAGGGTLLSFPAAIAWGLPSTVANATNAVAMAPGALASAWGYRRELGGDYRALAALSAPAMVGAVAGAAILHHTSQRLFDAIVPWLVLGATLMILFQGFLVRGRDVAPPTATRGRTLGAMACQLLVGVYGGYFGAAMGIVMVALFAMLPGDIQSRVGLKNAMAAVANGVAAVYFVASGLVDPHASLIMVPAGLIGGLVGGHVARRSSPRVVRALIVAIGLGVSALLGYRALAVRHV